jgi:tagatose 1,6-diphosphate aldolase GatY/KbaY
MLASLPELLAAARARDAAVGAFTAYNLETVAATVRAAEARETPVMMLVSAAAFRSSLGRALTGALVAAADGAAVPCCVQLDHVSDLDTMRMALELGCGALMADGSKLPDDENAALVRAAVELATAHGAHVEAELGRIEGDEEVASATRAGALTDPGQAAFMAETGAACLAVSIGNVHGTYAAPPQLDWPRLAAIAEAVDVPLSLHGASGLNDADVRRCVAGGVRKVNVNTELRRRHFAVLRDHVAEFERGSRMLALGELLAEYVADVVERKLDILDGRSEGCETLPLQGRT